METPVEIIKDTFMRIFNNNKDIYNIQPPILPLDKYWPTANYRLQLPTSNNTSVTTNGKNFDFSKKGDNSHYSNIKWKPNISHNIADVNIYVYFVDSVIHNGDTHIIEKDIIFVSAETNSFFSKTISCLYAYKIQLKDGKILLEPYNVSMEQKKKNSNRMLTSEFDLIKSQTTHNPEFCPDDLLHDPTQQNNIITDIMKVLKKVYDANNILPKSELVQTNKNIKIKKLSQGSYGETGLVEDSSTNSKYVVKTLLQKYETNNYQNKRIKNNFVQEAHTINLVSPEHTCNPYIVCGRTCTKNLFSDNFSNTNSFCMEYIDGIELYDLIHGWSNSDSDEKISDKTQKYLSIIGCDFNKLLQIFMDITQGLKVLHDKNLVYRDLKPENIMIYMGENNTIRAKLIDLGMVCKNDAENSNLCNDIAGTPGYIDPVVYTTKKSTKETDIFSLGIVILLCLVWFCYYCKQLNNFNHKNVLALLNNIHAKYINLNIALTFPTNQIIKNNYAEAARLVDNIIQAEKANGENGIIYSKYYETALKMINPQNRPIIDDIIKLLNNDNIKIFKLSSETLPAAGLPSIEPTTVATITQQMHGGSKNAINYEYKYKKYKQKYLDLKHNI